MYHRIGALRVAAAPLFTNGLLANVRAKRQPRRSKQGGSAQALKVRDLRQVDQNHLSARRLLMSTPINSYSTTGTGSAAGGAPIIGAERRRSDGPGPEVMDAATLIGDTVVNSSGEDLGKIEAIMLDITGGRVAYAVLSFGGFLGMGSKYFAIPWSAFTLDAGEKRFILGVSKDRLENAPGFDKDHWPSMADPTWATEVHAYYNVTPYWDNNLDTARDRRSTPDELTTPRIY
jgi:sporulation protein YlmC with PRC-barrel domain